ncbi:aldose epimerase family protein [Caldiplasma sukawensis]
MNLLIKYDETTCEIDTHGAYIKSLNISDKEIIKESSDGHQTHGGIAFLCPYANRIENGTYTFEGKTYHFEKNSEGHSIHGFAKDSDFEIKEKSENSVKMEMNLFRDSYPFNVSVEMEISVSDGILTEIAHFRNNGKLDSPLSPGFHPYFLTGEKWAVIFEKKPLRSVKERKYFPSGNYIESKRIIRSGGNFDDTFKYSGKLNIEGNNFNVEMEPFSSSYIQIYNGEYCENRSVAVEPMAGEVNSFNNRMGLKILKPDETWSFGYTLRFKTNNLKENLES